MELGGQRARHRKFNTQLDLTAKRNKVEGRDERSRPRRMDTDTINFSKTCLTGVGHLYAWTLHDRQGQRNENVRSAEQTPE